MAQQKKSQSLEVKSTDPQSVRDVLRKLVNTPPVWSVVNLRVKGTAPLIVNKFSEKARQQMLDKQMGRAANKKPHKIPTEDYNGARYLAVDSKGKQWDCVPAVSFKAAMYEAAKDVENVHGTNIKRGIVILGELADGALLPIQTPHAEPIMREDYVRLESGVCDIRFRPEYRDWSIDVPIRYNPRAISLEQLIHLMNSAGLFIGLCELRPCAKNSAAGGTYGTFEVDLEASMSQNDAGAKAA